jgi:hypothetical protein
MRLAAREALKVACQLSLQEAKGSVCRCCTT